MCLKLTIGKEDYACMYAMLRIKLIDTWQLINTSLQNICTSVLDNRWKTKKTSIDSTAQVRTKEQDHCTAAIIDTQNSQIPYYKKACSVLMMVQKKLLALKGYKHITESVTLTTSTSHSLRQSQTKTTYHCSYHHWLQLPCQPCWVLWHRNLWYIILCSRLQHIQILLRIKDFHLEFHCLCNSFLAHFIDLGHVEGRIDWRGMTSSICVTLLYWPTAHITNQSSV